MSNNPQRDAIRRELLEIEKKLNDLQLKQQDYDLPKLESLIEEQSYIEAYESSYQFLQHSWSTFEPSDFLPAKHLHAISEHLDACLAGQIKNTICDFNRIRAFHSLMRFHIQPKIRKINFKC
jgi:hypothetical protein